jgi:hypothetical protein
LKNLLWHLLRNWLHYFAREVILLISAFLHFHEIIPDISDILIVVHHFQSYLDWSVFVRLWNLLHHSEAFRTLQTIFIDAINLLNIYWNSGLYVFYFFELVWDQFLFALIVALKQF